MQFTRIAQNTAKEKFHEIEEVQNFLDAALNIIYLFWTFFCFSLRLFLLIPYLHRHCYCFKTNSFPTSCTFACRNNLRIFRGVDFEHPSLKENEMLGILTISENKLTWSNTEKFNIVK